MADDDAEELPGFWKSVTSHLRGLAAAAAALLTALGHRERRLHVERAVRRRPRVLLLATLQGCATKTRLVWTSSGNASSILTVVNLPSASLFRATASAQVDVINCTRLVRLFQELVGQQLDLSRLTRRTLLFPIVGKQEDFLTCQALQVHRRTSLVAVEPRPRPAEAALIGGCLSVVVTDVEKVGDPPLILILP
ncbi:hypothetical protein QCE73_00105 [Caballeronia sp. LZ029]|uniref:hypothetical protein n=1 Tax=Caballeronia sp. LZ029 TaxID=3038564 RepID=UPI0028643016|nr:hypothetical protein [Caballeronia sp. LZ029]MDR5741550.1 hypothetical protein [Caballeronia sp. LZ029]